MLHINIVGVVTCSNTRLADLSCVSLDLFFNSFHYHIHSSIAVTSSSQYKKKN